MEEQSAPNVLGEEEYSCIHGFLEVLAGAGRVFEAGKEMAVLEHRMSEAGGLSDAAARNPVPWRDHAVLPNPDYTPVASTLTFAAGVTTRTFSVPIVQIPLLGV